MQLSRLGVVAAALCFLAAPLQGLAQDLTSPHLEQLRSEAEAIRRGGAALGYSDTLFGALNNLHERMFVHDEQNLRIDQAIEVANGTTAELEAYRQSEDARRVVTREDVYDDIYQEHWEHTLEGILIAGGYETGAIIGGAATLLAAILVPVTKKVWKEMDLRELERQIAAHKLRTRDFYAVKVMVDHVRAETAARIRSVEAAQDAYHDKLAEIGEETKRLREAAKAVPEPKDDFRLTQLANLTRDTAALEDAFMLLEEETGLAVEEYRWHWSARKAAEDRIYYCPPLNGISALTIDGTDRYNVASQLCHAAVHAGAVTDAGGFIRVRHYPADPNFKLVSSTRNGITSGTYGSKSPTFSFVPVLQ